MSILLAGFYDSLEIFNTSLADGWMASWALWIIKKNKIIVTQNISSVINTLRSLNIF